MTPALALWCDLMTAHPAAVWARWWLAVLGR